MKSRVKPMTPGIPHGARIRAYLAAVVVTAGLSGVAWRAWALQVEDGDHYRAIAVRQHELTVEIPAPRGDVIDARGRPLAVSAGADSIWANPHDIRDVTDTADRLAKLLGVGAAGLEAKLGGGHRFVWLARRVTPELARRVREARLAGIEVTTEPRRWYPARAIGGTVIGRADIDGKGVDGIELAMNAQLVGHRGEGLALRDVRGKRMFADGLERPEPGATVQLSLDATIQAIAEAAIGDTVRATRARSGVVVAIEVGTGRVLAMASWPTSDPNGPGATARSAGSGGSDGPGTSAAEPGAGADSPAAASGAPRPEAARNRAVTDVYEAGSVMKIFSIAAALDDGTVAPDTVFDLGGGQFVVGGSKAIRDVHPDPSLTVAGIIKRSSNVGAAKIALRFGAAKLHAALRRFGFGARTGIELPGEQPGLLRDPARWRDRDLASIAFGYGLSVTPLQVAAATAAFGNRGIYVEPRIVERVIDGDGTLLYQADPVERRVVSDRTAAAMLAMLAAVFEGGKQNGTASAVVVPGFRCAGKTGTANRYDPTTHSYADRYLSSFAGLAPLDHPRLAIVAMVDEPSGSDHYGGTIAGPVFARVASEALRYLGVPGEPAVCAPAAPAPPGSPASEAPKTCLPPPARAAQHAPHADAAAAANSGRPAVASATSSAMPAPASVASPTSAPIATGDTAATAAAMVPDFRGMGIARAIAAARDTHLQVALSGTGRVVEQRPPPGPRGSETRVWLRLSDGGAAAP